MAFIAFLDACVPYPAVLRDVLLTVAEAGCYQIRWSPDVLNEMERNLAERSKAPSAKQAADGARYVRRVMEDAFPDAMVEQRAYRPFIDHMTNDPKDRHVLAAAVAGRADVIVTANVADFPSEACAHFGIEVQDPETFLCHQFELAPNPFMPTLYFLSTQRTPPMNSVEGILSALLRAAPNFCAMADSFRKT